MPVVHGMLCLVFIVLNGENMAEIKDKIRQIHDEIKASWYISAGNLKLNGEIWNNAILGCMAGSLCSANTMLTGNPGWGKTTIAEAVNAMLYGIPPEVSMHSEMKGHPFQTEEKIFGRPHLGELNRGNEKVIWSTHIKSGDFGSIIVDEINRFHEGHQNTILDWVDRGRVGYLNELFLYGKKPPFSATANYPDEGNSPIIPPLRDRFNLSVEIVTPVNEYLLGADIAEKEKEKFRNEGIESRYMQILQEMHSREDSAGKILNEIIPKYREYLNTQNIPVLSGVELSEIGKRKSNISTDKECELFLVFIYSGVNSIIRVPGDAESEHYKDTPFGKVGNNLSYRFFRGSLELSRALAVLSGKEEVDAEAMKKALAYTLPHRIAFKDEYIASNMKEEHFPGSQQLYTTLRWISDLEEYFAQHKDIYRQYLKAQINNENTDFTSYDLPQIRAGLYSREPVF